MATNDQRAARPPLGSALTPAAGSIFVAVTHCLDSIAPARVSEWAVR
ncbi:hypothetical protein PU560_07250 [Georgenia sp. 10Sc9-8]|uniref:Uncharacterized protein n=1 Tax=Georgenia halotolerans TaxID=3028317 RepID=A0ABT5TW27_9MICO|nr:hypothetical protein [Georgenia halotolerans]